MTDKSKDAFEEYKKEHGTKALDNEQINKIKQRFCNAADNTLIML